MGVARRSSSLPRRQEMSGAVLGVVVGVTLAVVAGVVLSAYGGAGVAILVPFAAVLLGGVGAPLVGYLFERRRRP